MRPIKRTALDKPTLRKYMLTNSGQEAHFLEGNEYVAVCWNIRKTEKSIEGKDKLTYTARVWERVPGTKPYIDFISVREFEKDKFFADEDSPAKGGQSAESATKLAEELLRAVEYLNKALRGKI